MNFFIVGGAIRDELLGLKPTEKDWVVIGATAEKMQSLGYKQVGKEFPVFLHPQSKEEYALARTEKKIAPGHSGFEFHSAPEITLEQDLNRRDLTINAMAKNVNGTIIDPFNGRSDLSNRILRHVSPAFAEDPLRVLRVARIKAQLADFGFTVATETLQLMARLVDNGEISALSSERIWKETEKALSSSKPSLYFETLRECGALKVLFPELDALYGVPQRADFHPEIDSGIHTMMVIDRAAELTDDLGVRFAAMTHDLGKALTPVSQWPRHIGHEKRGLKPLRQLFNKYPVPNKIRKIAELCCEHHLLMHKFTELRAQTVFKLIKKLDGFRQPQHIEQYVLLCQADSQGRKGFHDAAYPQADMLRTIFRHLNEVSAADVNDDQLSGPALGKAINRLRLSKVKKLQAELKLLN